MTQIGRDLVDYYIYLTTNKINNKKYIGQHKGSPTDNYFGSGTTILKAIAKYGKENFTKEILCFCETREEADQKEKEYIQLYNAVESKDFYNNAEGGAGGDGWRAFRRWAEQHPEEAKNSWKENGERLQQWRKENPKQYYEKCTKPFLEGSKKWRENNPAEMTEIMERVNKGKLKWQKEHPEEHQKQVDEWRKAGSEANSKAVECITTGEVFNSISEAARTYGIIQGNISKCLKGERKSAGKHPETGEKLFWKLV